MKNTFCKVKHRDVECGKIDSLTVENNDASPRGHQDKTYDISWVSAIVPRPIYSKCRAYTP